MFVFLTYPIWMVVILISSLTKINAPPTGRQTVENNRKIQNCLTDITKIFDGDQLSVHALTAINHFSRAEITNITDLPEKFSCVYNLPWDPSNPAKEYVNFNDLFAYYSAFEPNLISATIPNPTEYCQKLPEELEIQLEKPDECVEQLNKYYSPNNHFALIATFYRYRIGHLPVIELDVLNGDPIDISFEYYSRIRRGVKVRKYSGRTQTGMKIPLDFCTDRYQLPTN